ncbi:beta-ACP synthase [Streptomyces morookaense]|uniref:beta-ketoacyl synthase N-terminal-like domain-containing protein n=1 Tax=Streptomyces morookaense TaxID=1970 RepID=UPI00167D307B|nr:beta-ketoacyl synthase N-terminal-like domain-containing protein [Streptomyces morookaense]GHF37321.1 beta-ACP synthase [Streptomyces morookaense]
MNGEPPVLTGWGSVTPAGVGRAAFHRTLAVAPGRPGGTDGCFAEVLPVQEAFAAVDFDGPGLLGAKATRFTDRSSELALVACESAVADSGLEIGDGNRDCVGVAVGTSAGSVSRGYWFGRETFLAARPHMVNPALFPNGALNGSAAETAIRLGARGANVTVSAGRTSGLVALRHAVAALRGGYARTVLAGAVEEFTPPNAWVARAGRDPDGRRFQGEAAVFFVVEDAGTARRAGRVPRAELLATEVACPGGPVTEGAYADVIDAALARAAVSAEAVTAVSATGTGAASDALWRTAARRRFGRPGTRWLDPEPYFGDCFGAMATVQLAEVLARQEADPRPGPAVAVVLAADADCGLAVCVVRPSAPREVQ